MSDHSLTAQEAREALYEVVRQEIPFEQKAREALELGVEYLGADNGHLTRINQETNHWEAIVSTDPPDGRFPEGLRLDLETTYCRRTLDSSSQVTLWDAPNQGWDDDPAFETHGLHCYQGTTLILDEEPYGTVCFVAEEPRQTAFSDGETMFAELITRMLERELEREQTEAELSRQTNLATVLNRVLRHNIRNDMCVIRGYTQLMADELGENPHSEAALHNMDKLLGLSQKARELEKVVAGDFEREPTEIVALIEDVIGAVGKEYPGASFSFEHAGEDIHAPVLASFRQAITEVVENAAKHAGSTPTVTVVVEPKPDAVEIRVADDGPGISDQEADVLREGSETPLTHGSGLGLWLAYWVVTSHDGSLDVSVTEQGTTVTIAVPRKPTRNVQQQLQKLSRARDQYQAAFEEASDAMVIINDDARIVDANPEASRLYGVDNQELLGRSVREFLPEDFDFEATWESFQRERQDRDTITMVTGEGEERPVEYTATTDIIPGQHLVVSRDMTESVEREEALAEATQYLKTVIGVSPDPVIAVDGDGTVQLWNEAAEDVFGYTADAVIGEPIQSLELHSDETLSEFEEKLTRAMSGEKFTNLEVERQTKDGEWIPLSISTAPMRDESGTITGVMAIAKDLSEHGNSRQPN